jgi:hypothetical protein
MLIDVRVVLDDPDQVGFEVSCRGEPIVGESIDVGVDGSEDQLTPAVSAILRVVAPA